MLAAIKKVHSLDNLINELNKPRGGGENRDERGEKWGLIRENSRR